MGYPPPTHTPRVVLALWISLALILSPTAAFAAPAASALAQATAYEDPDGRFTLEVPEGFTDQVDITYEMIADNPLDTLLASAGVAFAEPESPNGVSVLFLLLDESITDRDEFAGFLAAFQVAAGGEVLPLVDLDFTAGDDLAAAGSATTRERHLQIEIEAQDNVVAVLSASVERGRYRELRSALSDALDSFTWNPETVQTSLGGEPAPTPEEPAVEATPEPEPEQEPTEEPADAEPSDVARPEGDAALETERYADPDGVFSVTLPAGLDVQDVSDREDAILLQGFFGPDDEDVPTFAVAFTPVAYSLGAQDADGLPDFRAVEDEEWNQFVDQFVIESFEGMTAVIDQRSDRYRTAFLVLETEEAGAEVPEAWLWLEEYDGIAAILIVFGELDDPRNPEIIHTALTSFAWSPEAATTATATLSGAMDPADVPVAFDDPFDLVALSTPPDYPFQAAYFTTESVEYTFGRNPVDGVFQISLSVPSNSAFNASSWSIIVDETETTILDTLSDGSLGRSARIADKIIGQPDVGADNSAVVLGRTDAYWMGIALLDVDGVLVTEVFVLPDSYWQVYGKFVEAAVEQGVDFDPDAVRDAIDAAQERGATVLETGAADALPSSGEEIAWRNSFETDDPFTLAVDFAESGLEGTFKAIVFAESLPDYPTAQFAMWLGEQEHVSYGKMTSQEDAGTRAAFTYTPDFPSNPGTYIAYLYYDNDLIAANGFTIEDNPPDSAQIANFGPAYGNVFDGEPLLVTTAIHPGDIVTVRGTGDLPAASQLRLFWYDPDGWLLTEEVATIRLDASFHLPYDWVYYDPEVAWQPGTYGYLLTLDGEPLLEGNLLVVEESAEVELTPGGEEVFAGLPLPPDLPTVPVVEGIDLAVVPSEAYTDRDIISTVDAWLRMQGWEPALPSIGAPVAWDYRRWVKDGYQFVLQPGSDGSEGELWMRYAPLSDVADGPLPSGDALDAGNLSAMAEVAQLRIEGLDVSQAVISPDGNWLAVTTTDGTFYIFDALRLMDTIWWQPDAYYANPVFSPDSRDLAVTVQLQSRSELQLFSNFDVIWLPTTRFNGHTDAITAIDYQPDGWLASGGLDGGLRQWDPSGEFLPVVVDTDEPVTGLAAAPQDAPGLLVAREGGWLEYRLDDGDIPWSELGTVTASPRIAAWSQFDDDGVGDLAVYGEGPAEWYAYDTVDAGLVADLPEDGAEFASTGAAFSPNGALLLVSGDTVHFFERATGAALDEWEVLVDGVRTPITGMGMSPDGRYVIVVSEDGTLRLWSAAVQ